MKDIEKMEMIQPKNVWKAFDGTLFAKKSECIEYEDENKNAQRRYARLLVYELKVGYFVGSTKFTTNTYVITDRTLEEVITYIIQFFGNCFDQKVSGTYERKWSISSSTLTWSEALVQADENEKKSSNIYNVPHVIFVSRNYLKGFPDPVYPNFRK